jgi:hypothetical protein
MKGASMDVSNIDSRFLARIKTARRGRGRQAV